MIKEQIVLAKFGVLLQNRAHLKIIDKPLQSICYLPFKQTVFLPRKILIIKINFIIINTLFILVHIFNLKSKGGQELTQS